MSTLPPAIPPAQNSGDTSPFDSIRRVDENGEHWTARDLQAVMDYAVWRDFVNAIDKAIVSCRTAGHDVPSNFAEVRKVAGHGPGALDYRLSRFACYLIAMNGYTSKPAVAAAQTYFAVKTREAEVAASSAFEIPTNMGDALRLAAEQYDRAEAERAGRVIAEQEVKQLLPAAESWDRLVNATGDRAVREAAQLLARDPEIKRMKIGQTKLFELLRDLGWLDKKSMPYQVHINNGRLALRMREWTDRDTKEAHTSYQVRVTAKGIHDLRGHLTGAKPLQLRLALVGDGLPEETA